MSAARLLGLGAVLVLLLGASMTPEEERVDELALAPPTPEALRDTMAAHARAVAASAPEAAGAAWHYVANSWARAGMPDSAIAALERALATRGSDSDRFGLARILLRRRQPGDVDRAIELMAGRRDPPGRGPGAMDTEGLVGWAQVLAGRPDSALTLFAPFRRQLKESPLWRFRLGRAMLDAGDIRGAYDTLLPLANASRAQDGEVMGMLKRIGQSTGVSNKIDQAVRQAISEKDYSDGQVIAALGGSRVVFPAPDGFMLGGVLLTPAEEAKHPRAAVVLMAPGDEIESYDSLAVVLHRAGFGVMLLDVRGSGWSVGPSCPAFDTWQGREDRMLDRVTHDVGAALGAIARRAPVDTTRYLVAGVGPTASMAAATAQIDPRVAALLIISPKPQVVECGPMKAAIAHRSIPVFYQLSPEDQRQMPITEAMYQAGNERASRISDSRFAGTGAVQFRYEPAVRERFVRWLDESLPAAGQPATRPRPRRGG